MKNKVNLLENRLVQFPKEYSRSSHLVDSVWGSLRFKPGTIVHGMQISCFSLTLWKYCIHYINICLKSPLIHISDEKNVNVNVHIAQIQQRIKDCEWQMDEIWSALVTALEEEDSETAAL